MLAAAVLCAVFRLLLSNLAAYAAATAFTTASLFLAVFAFLCYSRSKSAELLSRADLPARTLNVEVKGINRRPVFKKGFFFQPVLAHCDDGIDRHLFLIESAPRPVVGEKRVYCVASGGIIIGEINE